MIAQKDIEQYIRTHQLYHGDWCDISKQYKLSEELIREFVDYVEWFYISQYQKLSEEFIREFPDKVWVTEIFKYQELSPGLVKFVMEYNDFDERHISWTISVLKNRGIYNDKYEKVIEEYNKSLENKNAST